jgi:hypothetical protein
LKRQAISIVQYLPPYSPDFSLTELSFSVLKVCISRLVLGRVNIVRYRRGSSGILYPNFEAFLRMAIVHSRCDRFAHAHYPWFAHGVYLEREQWERARGQIQAFEQRRDLIWGVEDDGPEYILQFNS